MVFTACGKVILLGEHAVVYGKPCLAAGIDRGVEASFEPGGEALVLEVSPWGVRFVAGDESELGRALAALVAALPPSAPRVCGVVRAALHLPGTGGLGSSAALGVAVARTLGAAALGRALDEPETLTAALAWETVFHGTPSGVDHTVAARGGVGVFCKSAGFDPVPLRGSLRLLVADTGERTPTRETVASVRRIWEHRREETDKTFDAIEALVRNAALALRAGDIEGLGKLMDLNQVLLSSLLLSTERTEALLRAAREAGAFGAKLTGGGGGGCVIAVAEPDKESAVLAAWQALGAPAFVATIGQSAARAAQEVAS